ncbi:MAG: peptidylprolyl isomerase [Bacteroidetes bacterium]|nr:peptidylprolyl isomerase [Bacteroidota bacterium]
MKQIILGLIFLMTISFGFAQQKVVADKIVGIVGDKIILKSEILIANDDIQRQGGQPMDNCSLLDQMLTQKALVMQAEKDSIPVTEEDIEAEIDQRIRYFISQYGSREALEQISGRTVYQIKEDFRQPIREQRLAAGMRNKIVEGIKITPTEVKEYYEKIPKDNLHFYESELQIAQIILYPKASRDIEVLAIDELNDFKKQVEAGTKKFETLATLYTDDPGSKNKGGMYEVNKNDKQWDPTWFNAIWRLKEGQISPVIKSKMGYHIVQLVSRNGDDAVVRHILRIPQVTETEIGETVAKLDTIRSQLMSGALGFGEAVARYSDDDNAKFTAGRLLARDGSTYLTIEELDKDMVLLLKNENLKPGQYSKPTPYTDERGRKGVRLVELVSQSEPHRENLKDDYNKIAQKATEEKKMDVLQKWFQSKIPTYYVMIDSEFKDCANISKWKSATTASN